MAKKKATDEDVMPVNQIPQEVLDDPDISDAFKSDPMPEKVSGLNAGRVTEAVLNDKDEPVEEELPEVTETEPEAPEVKPEIEPKAETVAEPPAEPEGVKPEPAPAVEPEQIVVPPETGESKVLMTLKHKEKLIDVPDTDEGKERLKALAQMGFGYSLLTTEVKPYRKVLNYLKENPSVLDNLNDYMDGKVTDLITSINGTNEPEKFMPPVMKDDETYEEHQARIAQEAEAFYKNKAERDNRRTEVTSRVMGEIENDPMKDHTLLRIRAKLDSGEIPQGMVRFVDGNAEAFKWFYEAQKNMLTYETLFQSLVKNNYISQQTINDLAQGKVGKGPVPNKPASQNPTPQPKTAAPERPPVVESGGRRPEIPKGPKVDWNDRKAIANMTNEDFQKFIDKI